MLPPTQGILVVFGAGLKAWESAKIRYVTPLSRFVSNEQKNMLQARRVAAQLSPEKNRGNAPLARLARARARTRCPKW